MSGHRVVPTIENWPAQGGTIPKIPTGDRSDSDDSDDSLFEQSEGRLEDTPSENSNNEAILYEGPSLQDLVDAMIELHNLISEEELGDGEESENGQSERRLEKTPSENSNNEGILYQGASLQDLVDSRMEDYLSPEEELGDEEQSENEQSEGRLEKNPRENSKNDGIPERRRRRQRRPNLQDLIDDRAADDLSSEEESGDEEESGEEEEVDKYQLNRDRAEMNRIVKDWLQNEISPVQHFKSWLHQEVEHAAYDILFVEDDTYCENTELNEAATVLGILTRYEVRRRWMTLPYYYIHKFGTLVKRYIRESNIKQAENNLPLYRDLDGY